MDQSLKEDETGGDKVGDAMFFIMPSVSDGDLPDTEQAKLISVNSEKCRSTAFSASCFF